MNERIKELATRASKDDSDGYPVTLIYTNRFAENLGKLIVQECIECVDGYTKPRTGNTDYDAVEQIKQHFGIK